MKLLILSALLASTSAFMVPVTKTVSIFFVDIFNLFVDDLDTTLFSFKETVCHYTPSKINVSFSYTPIVL